jgi:hypothetical protein
VARRLFDSGIFSVGGPGWLLSFYTAGTTTPITTYNAQTGGSANPNPLVADANGRFGEIWIDQAQQIKWVLADENGAVQADFDNIGVDASPPTADASLTAFLAATSPLPVANGGTGATSGANALASLGALPAAGGSVSGLVTRQGHGGHVYFDNSAMTTPVIYITASGATDPRSGNPGEIWLQY